MGFKATGTESVRWREVISWSKGKGEGTEASRGLAQGEGFEPPGAGRAELGWLGWWRQAMLQGGGDLGGLTGDHSRGTSQSPLNR